jgi:hypothetical protein
MPTRAVVAIAASATALVLATILVIVVAGRQPGSSEANFEPSRLPVGGVVASWELPIGEYSGTAMAQRSRNIALTDIGIGPDAINHVKVIDAATGRERWSTGTRAAWMTNADGTLTATDDGIGFLAASAYAGGVAVQAVRLSSGEVVWESQPGGGYGASAVDGLVLLQSDTGLSALDQGTGKERWQWTRDGGCGEYSPQLDTAAPGVLIVRCGEAVERLDLGSGASWWRWSAKEGCELRHEASSIQVVGVVVTCGQEQRVHAIDAATGKERWFRAIDWDPAAGDPADPEQGASSVTVIPAGRTSLVMTDGLLSGPDGKPVRLEKSQVPVTISGGAGPDGLLLERAEGKGTTLTLVDLASGTPRWERALPFPTQHGHGGEQDGGYSLRTEGTRYYLVGKIPGIWPGIIGLVDARSGDLTLSASGRGDVEVIDVGEDGTVYATFGPYGKSRLTALRVTGASSGFLGTIVGADRWPDACRLLPTDQYQATYPGVTPTIRPLWVQLPEVELPAPVRCGYVPSSIHGTEVTVSVGWLADDAVAAERAAEVQDPHGRDPVPLSVGRAKRPALRWDDTNTGVDPAKRIRVSFAVGRCVANVETLGDSGPLPKFAGTVADSLASNAGCAA